MLAINISCYEELFMLLQLVFLKYALLWQDLHFGISPLKRYLQIQNLGAH